MPGSAKQVLARVFVFGLRYLSKPFGVVRLGPTRADVSFSHCFERAGDGKQAHINVYDDAAD